MSLFQVFSTLTQTKCHGNGSSTRYQPVKTVITGAPTKSREGTLLLNP